MFKFGIDELLASLERAIAQPQKSERWSMYRLIAPVVDYVCADTDWLPYFEYNQTSLHGASQSLDIALLSDGRPCVMIEAKRVDKRISSEQIAKYLDTSCRGLVSNGIDWIFCDGEKTASVCILTADRTNVCRASLELIIQFIRSGQVSHIDWRTGMTEVDARISAIRPDKASRASRISSGNVIFKTAVETYSYIEKNSKPSELERVLLQALFKHAQAEREWLRGLRFEVRDTRLSIFDDKLEPGAQRICRIAIGMGEPDIILRTELASARSGLDSIAKSFEHDKGSHMRCFRLGTVAQASEFGSRLGELLFASL